MKFLDSKQGGRRASVQFSDPKSPRGAEISPVEFARACQASALGRFHAGRGGVGGCAVVEYAVPPKFGDLASSGVIVAYVSPDVVAAWRKLSPPQFGDEETELERQMLLVLEDLGQQDIHGLLAFTRPQRTTYSDDLGQLVCEALERTTFSHLHRIPEIHWEGTLVERLSPPFVALILSIRFSAQPRKVAKRPSTTAKPRRAPKRR
ncbi:MAG: hypothetical protein ACYDBQ_12515 [Thermoplasmatota archaeon]